MADEKKSPAKKTGVAAWNESAGISSRSQASGSRHNRAEADKRKRIVALVALLVVCVASIVCAWPITQIINRGLWLEGGMAYTMEVAQEDGSKPTAEQLSQAVSTIQGRLGASGVSEYAVQQSGDDSLVINLPAMEKGEGIARLVGGAGLVEFVRMDEIGDADALIQINAGSNNAMLDKSTYKAFLDGSSVSEASVEEAGTGSYAVRIVFNDEGAQAFSGVTKELAEDSGRIAIVIDGRVNSAPSVSQQITGGEVYITGGFSAQEANALKAALDGETLPLVITYKGSEEIGPLMGEVMLWGLVGVAVIGFVVVSIISYIRYRKLALLEVGAMAVYAVLILGLMALASRLNMFTLTLPGVLGGMWAAITSIMAVWLVCARFQEKVQDGKSIKGAATSAPREALRPLGMPCVVAFVVAAVLLFVPMPALRDFGTVVVFGVLAGLAAVCWYAVTLLRLVAMGSIQANPSAWGVQVASVQDASGEAAS